VLVHGVTASARTWWRVGPWFAENGWRVVAVDLRDHGASPRMRGDEGLDDLAWDVHETVFEAHATELDATLTRKSPKAAVRRNLAQNPTWAEQDAKNSVTGLRDCDAGPLGEFLREGLRYDLTDLARSVTIPTLLVLGSAERDSMPPAPKRAAVAGSLRQGTTNEFDAGHSVHRDGFEGYVGLLGDWLGRSGA
jgi:pimeloyl-ACP methyl ester carboxylesterase